MGCTRMILGALGGGIVGGALGAGLNAASGAIGGAIFNAAGYSDYTAEEGAQMGAVGGAILSGSAGVIVGGLTGASPEIGGAAAGGMAVGGSFMITSVLSGLIGYGILNNHAATETLMNLGQTALSFLVGGATMTVGGACLIGCCFIPMAAAGMVAMNDKTPELEQNPDLEKQDKAEVVTSMRLQ